VRERRGKRQGETPRDEGGPLPYGVRERFHDSGDRIVNGTRGLRSLANPSAGAGSDRAPRHLSQNLPPNFWRINFRRDGNSSRGA